MPAVQDPLDEFAELSARSTDQMARLLVGLTRALVFKDQQAESTIMRQYANTVSSSQALSDLLGRRRVLLQRDFLADSATRSSSPLILGRPCPSCAWTFRKDPTADSPITTKFIPFQEAVDDLISREPRLAQSAAEVGRVYSQEHAFAAAKSAEIQVTASIQRVTAASLRAGVPIPEGTAMVQEAAGFSRSYAETVYRTNISTAYTAGTFRMSEDPDVMEIIGALRFTATGDVDTRPNHQAFDGMVARQDDPVWNVAGPPIGYN